MHPDSSPNPPFTSPEGQDSRHLQTSSKHPHTVLDNPKEAPRFTIFAFPPNRDTLGGTAYFIVNEGNVLVDCPAWNETNRAFLEMQGGVRFLFLTHRGAIGKVREIQRTFDCEVLIQEQEAYLLPELTITRFGQEFELTPDLHAIWTPGHSPGSSCLYYRQFGGVLFTGRHLLPDPQGKLLPIRTAKTFHWRRQLQSVQRLIERFTPETLQWICPGGNIGFLRGKYAIEQAYQVLAQLELKNQDI
ncbi:MBL fold metallo-hydrolase [Leptothermofonsia sp. ETS-13]|uniref:MBL fold metallo-hydrolase n=1 Tax=Leptothermofonsia sp. ETS-13 TaxID=3035696 RepID=UPI003BA39B81